MKWRHMKLFKIAQNWEDIANSMDRVTIIPRDSAVIREIIRSFGGTRFLIGYIKKDGSWRKFHAQVNVNKGVSTPEGAERERSLLEDNDMISVYDLDVARMASWDVKEIAKRYEAEHGVVDPTKLEAYKNKELHKSFRHIYLEKIELLGGRGKFWIVEDATNPEIQKLVEQKQQMEQAVPEEPQPNQ